MRRRMSGRVMAQSQWVIVIHLGLVALCLYPLVLRRELRSHEPGGRIVLAVMVIGIVAVAVVSLLPEVFLPAGWTPDRSDARTQEIRNAAIIPISFLPLLLLTPFAERLTAQRGRKWRVLQDVLAAYVIYAAAICVALYFRGPDR